MFEMSDEQREQAKAAFAMTDEQLQKAADFYGITVEEGRLRHAKVVSQGDDPAKPICIGCAKWPEELDEYVNAAKEYGMEVIAYVIDQEGTYNPENGHFLCTPCYQLNGSPTTHRGWKCP